MAKHINWGFGGEFHLLRYMGRYRNELNRKIGMLLGGSNVQWLDFYHGRKEDYKTHKTAMVSVPDIPRGISGFLPPCVQAAWKDFWPGSAYAPKWSSIGRLRIYKQVEWVLLDVKSRAGEMNSTCRARGETRLKIASIIDKMSREYSFDRGCHTGAWLDRYYNFSGQLAFLYFLNSICRIPANLICIYFSGDRHPALQDNRGSLYCGSGEISDCDKEWHDLIDRIAFPEGPPDFNPASESQWRHLIDRRNLEMGIADKKIRFNIGLYEMFLAAAPGNGQDDISLSAANLS